MPVYTRSYVKRVTPRRYQRVYRKRTYTARRRAPTYMWQRAMAKTQPRRYRNRMGVNWGGYRRPLGHEGLSDDAWALLSDTDRMGRIQDAANKKVTELRLQLGRYAGKGDSLSVRKVGELNQAINMNMLISENAPDDTTQSLIKALLQVKPMSAVKAMATGVSQV